MRELVTVINELDSIGFQDRFDDYLDNLRSITGWKDNKSKKKEVIHKSTDYLHLTSDLLKKFLKCNQEDYLIYYNIKSKTAHRRLALSLEYDLLSSKLCV